MGEPIKDQNERIPIKDQKVLYHLTNIKNLISIIQKGLLPRTRLTEFEDVADQEILRKRKVLGLDNMIPFHFFENNPFDDNVFKTHPDESFVYLVLYRTYAITHNWKVIPRHPLSNITKDDIKPYKEGFDAIDWKIMEKRDYYDHDCKMICMAEALSPDPIPFVDFNYLNVKDENTKKAFEEVFKECQIPVKVGIYRKGKQI